MVKEYLIKSYNGDIEAREQMHYGQCLWMAFSNALLDMS
jgi:alcohol dehydrogenase class IV